MLRLVFSLKLLGKTSMYSWNICKQLHADAQLITVIYILDNP